MLEQQECAYHILYKIKEWLECSDYSNFKPLRCTSTQGGTGKSVLINTIVSILRQSFQQNNIVAVAAPTRTTAYNVNGTTLHSFPSQSPEQMESTFSHGSIPANKYNNLIKHNKDLLCLIIDERSLMPTKILGNTERVVTDTCFNGVG